MGIDRVVHSYVEDHIGNTFNGGFRSLCQLDGLLIYSRQLKNYISRAISPWQSDHTDEHSSQINPYSDIQTSSYAILGMIFETCNLIRTPDQLRLHTRGIRLGMQDIERDVGTRHKKLLDKWTTENIGTTIKNIEWVGVQIEHNKQIHQ